MTEDLIEVSSLVISVSSTSGLASRGQKEDIALLCSQEKSHPWGVPWWGFILNIKTIYFWMCHLEERKSHNCVFWNGSENIFPYIPKNMQQHHTLDQNWTLRLQHQQFFAAEMSKYSKCFIGFFSDNLACWDKISIKLWPSSSFLHTSVFRSVRGDE